MKSPKFILIRKDEYIRHYETYDSSTNYLINTENIQVLSYAPGQVFIQLNRGEINLEVSDEQLSNIFSKLDVPELLI